MQVDVNNGFNSAEDKVQYALGSMDAFAIRATHISNNSGANFPGIIALNHAQALIKFLGHFSTYADSYSLTVTNL